MFGGSKPASLEPGDAGKSFVPCGGELCASADANVCLLQIIALILFYCRIRGWLHGEAVAARLILKGARVCVCVDILENHRGALTWSPLRIFASAFCFSPVKIKRQTLTTSLLFWFRAAWLFCVGPSKVLHLILEPNTLDPYSLLSSLAILSSPSLGGARRDPC